MGHRASYVVIEHGQVSITSDHWGALRVPEDVLLGPDRLVPYLRGCSPAHELLDGVWCEGAILVDLDQRVLLAFGGQTPELEWPSQQAWLRVARAVWREWDLRWTRSDVWDLSSYLYGDAAGPEPGHSGGSLSLHSGNLASMISVVESSGEVVDLGGEDHRPALLLWGTELFDEMREHPAQPLALPDPRLDMDAIGGGGVIDLQQKTISFWMSAASCGWETGIREAWPGFDVRHEDGGLPAQLASTGRDPALARIDWDGLVRGWVDKLLEQPADLKLLVEEVVFRETLEGRRVVVNPEAVKESRPVVRDEERAALREALVAALASDAHAAQPTPDVTPPPRSAPAPIAPATLPVTDAAYAEEDLARFALLIGGPGWSLTSGATNEHGLYEAVHERSGLVFVLVPAGATPEGDEVATFLMATTPCTHEAWVRVAPTDQGPTISSDDALLDLQEHEAASWCWAAGLPRPGHVVTRDATLRLTTEDEWAYACRCPSMGTLTYAWFRPAASLP